MVAGEPSQVSAIVTHAVVEQPNAFDVVEAADKARQQAKLLIENQQDAERNRQKMEALGRTLGGCAHEINNMLQPISLLTQDMIDNETDVGAARPMLEVILDCSRQASQILGDLLVFTKPGTRTSEVLDLRLLVTSSLGLVRQAVPATIVISTVVDGSVPSVDINRTAFNQVMLNLATNAAGAMGGTGTLTFTLGEYVKDPGPASAGQQSRFARIAVADTGCGMSKGILDHVFEPFFTTKPVGQGTGLGLTVVYGLIYEMRGTITLASEPGRGTTVTILIPAVDP
jgi:signal transduction histidine kinase